VLPRNEIEQHQQNECQQQQISCGYFDIGCHVKIKRCQLDKHNHDYNTHHTKLLFDKLSATNIELAFVRKEFQETKQELSETRNKLFATQNELAATRREQKSTRNELVQIKEVISKLATPKHQTVLRAAKQPTTTQLIATPPSRTIATPPSRPIPTLPTRPIPTTTQPIPTPPTQPTVEEETILLMSEVLRLNQPRATQSSYRENVKRMSELMKNGELHNLSEDECFFKLKLKRNCQSLYIFLVEDLTGIRNHPHNEFANEDIVLQDWFSFYRLYVSIRKYDKKNSKCFLVDTKRSGNNRLLVYGENVGWNDYKDENDYVIFYFTKK